MISVLVSVLATAAAVALAGPAAQPAKPSAASGLTSTGQMIVRAVVADRCEVGPSGAVCQGAAPIKPLAVDRPSATRVDIIF